MGRSTMRQTGPLVTNNSISMIFALQLRMDFQHRCRIKWNINIGTITSFSKKNDVTSCPIWRQKIIESELQIKSKYLITLRQHRKILTVIYMQRLHTIRRQILVYYQPKSSRVRNLPIIKVLVITEWCEWSLECMNASIDCIAQKIALYTSTTMNPPRKGW